MKATFKQKFQYFFDNTLSRGTGSIIIWLSVVTVVLVLIFSGIYMLFGIEFEDTHQINFIEALWQSFMRSIDPGTVAGDTKWGLRIIGLIVTISGIFILSSLIGILSTGLESKLEELRKGKSIVLVQNHTLIVGWSQKIFHIISELIEANSNQHKPAIVILGNKDKVEMDDEIRAAIPDTKNTKIITRSGNPLDVDALKIVNPDDTKSIIILLPEEELANPDIYVIKSVLALLYNPNRTNKKYHIVAEINDIDNLDAAEAVGKDETSFLFTQDIISKITAQTSHQPGLSLIYMDLFCYEGDELYFTNLKQLKEKSYKDVIFAFDSSTVIGFKNNEGSIFINPPMDTIISEDDEILAISEDDDTVIPSNLNDYKINFDIINKKERISSVSVEKNIILGWNERAEQIILELDQYVDITSTMTVVSLNNNIKDRINGLNKQLKNQTINIGEKNYSKRKSLVELNITEYNNIIVLSNNSISPQEADALTILALIHIRNIAKEHNVKLNIISEMFDQKNRELAEVTEADDFIISQDLISRMIAQISETKDLKRVFDALFEADGSEIYIKDITDYVDVSQAMNFYTLLEAAALKKETAIGYRILELAHSTNDHYGIVINPKKSNVVKFEEDDKIIVLSED